MNFLIILHYFCLCGTAHYHSVILIIVAYTLVHSKVDRIKLTWVTSVAHTIPPYHSSHNTAKLCQSQFVNNKQA